MKRFYIHTIVCLLASCFCTAASAQGYYPSSEASLSVAGVEVNETNRHDVFNDGGSVSYDPSTKTLTLNNFKAVGGAMEYYSAISSDNAVKYIHLKGKNVFTSMRDIMPVSLVLRGWDDYKGEEIIIYGDSAQDMLECGNLSVDFYPLITEEGIGHPDIKLVHLRVRNCTLKTNSGVGSYAGLKGNGGRLTIENASVIVKSLSTGIQKWGSLVMGDGIGITQPYGATFSETLGAVTLDGETPYNGNISIVRNDGRIYQNAYVLYHKDGSVTGFSFSEQPVISYSGEELVVTTGSLSVQYPLCHLRKLVVEGLLDSSDGIDEVTIPDTEFHFSDEGATVRGEKPGTPFYVFDTRGMKLHQGTIDASGRADIHMTNLPKGIYVIKTQSTSFKIKK